MTVMTKDEVRDALRPFHARIKQVVEDGYREWQDVTAYCTSKGYSSVLYSRTVANYVFDAIARNAKSIFKDDKRVRVKKETQTLKLIFDGKVIVRFKKGDKDHLSQNIPTQAVLDYHDPQQTIPGLPPEAAKVEVMWAADDIGTKIEAVTVIARSGNRSLWSYIIDDEASSAADPNILPFPTDPSTDERSPLIVIKPRKTERESS
ncbi:hypothetical protein IR196_04765 [Brucella anthropi]|uniref:hypothetical protein n=1 Tax=Brucella anthropi TaxID=529 RepID=UPI00188A596A|nr:hypothetical protein [Brucella anthropi]QPA27181.1 hypothetical protein IR196_04765 [Brucella anthropi]